MLIDGKIYLTPAEVVERFQGKISVRTLANWRSSGVSPPFTKVGGRILYPVRELLEWERNRTVNSTADYGKLAVYLIPAFPLLIELAAIIA